MEANEAILTRRSIRRYTNKMVTDEQLDILLKAAMYAPSAVNKQPWHFVVFRSKKLMEEIVQVHKNAWMLNDASVAILVCFDEKLQHDTGYGPIDCSAASQNILLSAHALGLGACWIGIYPRDNRVEALHQIFNLPGHIQPFSVIAIGYSNEQKPFPERYRKDRIHYEKW